MTATGVAIALGLALVACGGGGAQATSQPKAAAIDQDKAETGAKELIDEIYQSVRTGDTDGLQTLLADTLVVLGPRRGDALASRADALVALKQVVDAKAKKKPAIESSGLVVVPSAGGHSAWAADVLTIGERSFSTLVVLSNTNDIWLVDAVLLAEQSKAKLVRRSNKQAAVMPPGAAGVAKIDPNARPVIDKLSKGLATPSLFADDLTARGDATYLGPTIDELVHGKKDMKKLWKRRAKANVREAAAGEVAAAVTADGQLAWVTAPVVRFSDDDEPMPLRVFAIFEKRGGEWKLIAMDEAAAIDEAGSAAQLLKTQAPAGSGSGSGAGAGKKKSTSQ
jgi:ketosteroid isomerase-like protein